MPNLPTFLVNPDPQPALFVDCPFCLAPLPLDPATGSIDCDACGVHLELAPEPHPAAAPLPTAA